MKTMTCKDLGGPCDYKIGGDSFEAIGKASYMHVMEQIKAGDAAHMAAAAAMRNASPEEQTKMMAEFKARFEAA